MPNQSNPCTPQCCPCCGGPGPVRADGLMCGGCEREAGLTAEQINEIVLEGRE